MNFRVIAKFCFLVVIIGFCMPMACDSNGFDIAKSEFASTELSFALYVLFISAIVGVLIGILLATGKNVPLFIDWITILVCVLCGVIPFFINKNDYDYQSGVYMIMTGYALIIIFQFIPNSSSNSSYSRSSYSSNKRCRQCETIYSGSHSSCPRCNSSLYEETNQSIDSSISPNVPVNKAG